MERQLTLRLPVELATRIEHLARRLTRQHSEVVRAALEQHLDTPWKMSFCSIPARLPSNLANSHLVWLYP